ncbi:AT-rich interactive domain-containing protein 1B-like isoform X2 [Anguilla rostrata]|uniref:AT-rich interactive domain-containing protein 1B-like isoform X2 n=1 Tax=Anguilla rostrata TaxID=7938 RepID=UPI0030CBF32E
MAAQVASAPATSNNKNPNLPSSLSQELNSVKSEGGAAQGSGTMLGAGDGTSTMNNVDHHRHNEMNMANTTRASSACNNSDPRENDGGNNSSSVTSSNLSAASSMETGMIANHKLKNIGGDTPLHQHALPQQQFNQFQQHQRQIQNNINNSQTPVQGEAENQTHGFKENILENQVEPQQMLRKSEETLPCKSADQVGGRYEHASMGPTNNSGSINNQPQSAGGNSIVSEFNNYYGNARGGPCFDQHGGQQSPVMSIMHSSVPNSMDPTQNSHEGYHNSQYNHYPNYRASYGGAGYGVMSSSRQGSNMLIGPGSGSASTQGKTAMAAASASGGGVGGFQRFPGQNQHPPGATPTLNQLLTSPSPMMRGYGSGYDFNSATAQQQQQAGMGLGKDLSSQYGSAAHGWGGQQRNHPAISPGNNGQGINRPQVGSMEFMAMKRSQLYGMGNIPYAQQQGGPYSSQPYGSPAPHRYPMGTQGRGQMGMGGMQQMPPQFGQQGQPPYFSQSQQPAAPTQPPYLQPRAPSQQEVQPESYGPRGQPPLAPAKQGQEEMMMGLGQQERPSSLPFSLKNVQRFDAVPCQSKDLSGSIDDLPTGTEAGLSSAVSASGSSSGSGGEQSNPARSPFSPHASPAVAGLRTGPSPSPAASPAGSAQSRSGPISPAGIPGTPMAPPNQGNSGNMPDVGPHCVLSQSPMSQERGFIPNMQRNPPMAQFGPQQSGPSMSPHPSTGGQMHHGMGPYQQSGSSGAYGPTGVQFGPQGNFPRPPSYDGAPGSSYSGPGPGVTNSMGTNAGSPMQGQGPGMPLSHGRPYSGTVAPSSPSMPQSTAPNVAPPLANSNRKAQEAAAAVLQAAANTAQGRQNVCPPMSQMGIGVSGAPYSQPPGSTQGTTTLQGPMGLPGDGVVGSPPKPKADGKEESGPGAEPPKAKDVCGPQCTSQPSTPAPVPSPLSPTPTPTPTPAPLSPAPTPAPVPSPLCPSPASLSSYHGDDSDSISSPTWPKTPSSPKSYSSYSSTLSGEKAGRLYEMGAEPERKAWVERYLSFMEERGTAILSLPVVGKKPLDLFQLYMAVKEIGGLAMANKNKKWRELSNGLSVGTSGGAASSLKKQYIQYLFAFECQVERGEEPPPDAPPAAEGKKQPRVQPPSPANSGSLQGPQTPQSTSSGSMAELPGDLKPPTPASTPHGQMAPMQVGRSSSVSVQDPFSEVNDPAFQKRGSLPPGAPYQPPANIRMQDPFAGMRKVVSGAEPYMPGPMPNSGAPDVYGRPPSAAMPGLGMGQRPQYPYGPGYDRRPDHVMGLEGSMVPPGAQSNMVPSNSDPSMYSSNRYPSQQRHEGYSQQYPSMGYGAHPPGMFPQQQGYKRPMEGMYGPPPKRQDGGEGFGLQYGSQQAEVYNQYGGGYPGPERRPLQGPYPYPYGRERMQASGPSPQQPPPQLAMSPQMMGGPPGSGEGPQPGAWPPRTDMPYPYPSRQGASAQGPPYPAMGRGDDMEARTNHDGPWAQRQAAFLPPPSSSMPAMTTRPLPSSYQTPPSMPNHAPRAPSPASFQRSMEAHLSPSKAPFMSSMKMPKMGVAVPGSQGGGPAGHPPSTASQAQATAQDLNFPLGSVECTMPILKLRRKITSKDTGTPEAWRVMMSLKSGLLAESTWALDTISVLLYDNSTVSSFCLAQLPGFLELLVEYFRRCVMEIFGILEEYEVGTVGQKTLLCGPVLQNETEMESEAPPLESTHEAGVEPTEEPLEAEPRQDKSDPETVEPEVKKEESQENTPSSVEQEPTLKQASKYDRLPLKVVPVDSLFVEEQWEEPSQGEEFTSGLLHWQAGGGDSTAHIQTHFESRSEPYERRGSRTLEADGRNEQGTATEDVPWTHSGVFLDGNPFSLPAGSSPAPRLEEEPRTWDEAPLSTAAPWQDALSRRCVCVSNILRGLSFVPGNDVQMSQHAGLVLILGRLVLLHHQHPERSRAPRAYAQDRDRAGGRKHEQDHDRACEHGHEHTHKQDQNDEHNHEHEHNRKEDEDHNEEHTGKHEQQRDHNHKHDSVPNHDRDRERSLACSKDEWWWDCLSTLRENTMVTLANISGQLDLSQYPESICLPLLDGLLHWMVCPSAQSQDPFPRAGPHSALTPQRLVLECLCKLSVQDGNVDLLLATPPLSRQERLYTTLLRYVADRRNQVYREMGVAVLSNLAQGDALAARGIAVQKGSVGTLVSFLEDCVAMAQSQRGPAPSEPPSVNMMCRAAKALLAMARLEENRSEFVLFEGRLLDVSISSALSSAVAAIVCEVLFQISRS